MSTTTSTAFETAGRIVVGVDGSSQSAVATEWAARRAETLGVGLTLVLALPPLQVPSPGTLSQMIRQDASDFTTRVVRSATERLAQATEQARAQHPGLDIASALLEDSEPALALVRASQDAEMVVTGTRGLGAVRAMALGSVSRHLISHAHGPVAVVPETGTARDDSSAGTVLVGVEDADRSRALPVAIREASRIGGRLLVVHSWEYTPGTVEGLPMMDPDLFSRVQETFSTQLDEHVRAHLSEAPDLDVEVRVSLGHAGEVLVNASHEAELLVVGSRARTGLTGAVLGSTAAHVVRQSICPVIVVPTRG